MSLRRMTTLGIKPEFNGIMIDPCIPSVWKEFSMVKEFRGKRLNISVENQNGLQKGVSKVYLNGKELEGKLIPAEDMVEENDILVVMG